MSRLALVFACLVLASCCAAELTAGEHVCAAVPGLYSVPFATFVADDKYNGGGTPTQWSVSLCNRTSQAPPGYQPCQDGTYVGMYSKTPVPECGIPFSKPAGWQRGGDGVARGWFNMPSLGPNAAARQLRVEVACGPTQRCRKTAWQKYVRQCQ
jgi:hypothetical protein